MSEQTVAEILNIRCDGHVEGLYWWTDIRVTQTTLVTRECDLETVKAKLRAKRVQFHIIDEKK